jgi:hypothetical protein
MADRFHALDVLGRVGRADLQVERFEALLDRQSRIGRHRGGLLPRQVVEELHRVTDPASEEVDERLAAGLADEVPARHLNRGDARTGRVDVVPGTDHVHPLEDPFDPERVLPHDQIRDRAHDRLDDLRGRIGLAQPEEPLVGAELHDDGAQPPPPAERPQLVRSERHRHDGGVHRGDAHIVLASWSVSVEDCESSRRAGQPMSRGARSVAVSSSVSVAATSTVSETP